MLFVRFGSKQKSGSRHLILISNFRRRCSGCKDVPAHTAEQLRTVWDDLLNVQSLPLFFLLFVLPPLCHRLTVAPENTFAYTSQLQIHESKNEVSDKRHHAQVGSHTHTLTRITCMCGALTHGERRVIYTDLK